ncbi:putative carbohydrate binding domain containing protein [uncultured Mediterranean phage uvMED]|nr:putative carbohydrate binding domain containing protein [uncultured Mediterranean phage uvMED]
MATVNLGRIKPVFRGAYNNSTAYVIDDIVTSGNETFIAIAATQGNATTDASKWTKLAAKGADGTDVAATLANKEIAFKTNAGALDGIPIGTAGQALKVNSGATGYEFGTAGGILQVKQGTLKTFFGSSSGAYVDTGLQVSITPSSASNKVLVMVDFIIGTVTNGEGMYRISGGNAEADFIGDTRGSRTRVLGYMGDDAGNGADGAQTAEVASACILTTPNTTSAVTYKLQLNPRSQNTTINSNQADPNSAENASACSTITAMEIASGVL